MKSLSPNELAQKLRQRESMTIIDVRDAAMYDDWHIAGAVNVPVIQALRQGDAQALEHTLSSVPKDTPIVAVCNVGRSSQVAVQALESIGFDAINLTGGMRAWSGVWTEAAIDMRNSPDAVLMQVRRNGKGCLSYVLISDGTCAVVDPSVEARAYLDVAQHHGATVTHVIETHVHADHLSRARTLAAETSAQLCIPQTDRVTFDYMPVPDGQTIEVGSMSMRAIATPGHTTESTCYLIDDDVLLTGDTVFVDSVGRPDLERGDAGAEPGAHALFGSLHERIMTLPDSVRICPAHTTPDIGFDSEPIMATLGEVRSVVELLKLDESEFVANVLDRLTAKPPSHEAIIQINEGKAELGPYDPLDLEAGPNRCAVG